MTTVNVGSILIPTPATWQNEAVGGKFPVQRSWKWYRDGVEIPGAISGTYTTLQADVGTNITVKETAFFINETNNGSTFEAPHDTATAISDPVSVVGSAATDLVYADDIQYVGSFQLKTGEYDGAFGGGVVQSINHVSSSGSGRSMLCLGFNGNQNANPPRWAEIQIPTVLGNAFTTAASSLPYCSMSFPASTGHSGFYDIYNGQLQNSGIGDSGWYAAPTQPTYLGGTQKMIMGASVGYSPGRPHSLWWRRDKLLSSNTIDGIFTIRDPNAAGTYSRWTAGYVFPIPGEHQAALGNKQYMGGTFAMSIIQTQSDGPSACAFSNADIDDALSKYTAGTAQGGGSNTIRLATSDSRPDNFYNGMLIYVPSASQPSGYVKTITSYVASTKTATVDSNWTTPPTNTSTYKIYPNANGKQLFGYFEDELQALDPSGEASQARKINTIRKWDGGNLGGCMPNGTKSVLIFAVNGDGYSTYGLPGGLDGGGNADANSVKIYSPGVPGQNAPWAYPYYTKVYAYSVDDLAQVSNGTLAFNQVKPYGVWDFKIPYVNYPLKGFDFFGFRGAMAYDSNTRRIYLTSSDVVHVYEVMNAVATDAPLSLDTVDLPVPIENDTHYIAQFTASGGAAPYTWSKSGGNGISYGLAFDPAQARVAGSTGSLGTATFTITVTDSLGATASKTYTITRVPAAPAGMPVLTPTYRDLPQGTKDTVYAGTTLTASGTGPITWKLIGGSLPVGLTFNPATQQITGTPTVAGPSNFTLELRNSVGVDHFDLQIGVYGQPVNLTPPTAFIWRAG